MNGTEEVPAVDLPPGVASPLPLGFTVVLWMGAFAAMTWGMMVLFGGRRSVDRIDPPEFVHPEEP